MSNYPFVQKLAISQYEKSAKQGTKLYPSLELVRLEKWFFKSKRGKLLEYAFGGGCNTIHLAKCGYDIYGLDVSKNSVRLTNKRIFKINEIKKKPKLIHLNPKAKKLPYPDNYFDYIVVMSVLSLLGDEKKIRNLLIEFKRVLKFKGKIILDINDQNSAFSKRTNRIKNNIYKSKIVDGYIKTFCLKSEKDFKKLVENYFYVEDVGFSSHKLYGRTITEFIICAIKK